MEKPSSGKLMLEKHSFKNECKGGDDGAVLTGKGCWWNPLKTNLSVEFCEETSIHGFKFLGKPNRHITERIFWLIAFLLSLLAAIYLIFQVWDEYSKSPVIVAFQNSEQDIGDIPFPAVTICNMNPFPKSKVNQLKRIANLPDHPQHHKARKQLSFVKSVCSAQPSFAQDFNYAYNRGTLGADYDNITSTNFSQVEIMDFLLENTLPCDEFIRLCTLGKDLQNCSNLFKPIITNYGKCCTFNILPIPLLFRNSQSDENENQSIYDNPILGSAGEKNWPKAEIDQWIKWDYRNEFALSNTSTTPWKQKMAGKPYGLSFLVDPLTEEYFCPASDSKGIRYIIHTPLEMPHVMEYAAVADLNKEVFIEVHPDITNADVDIKTIAHEKRKCYYVNEKNLKFFSPYTGDNCADECIATVIGERCNCTPFFMPRDDGVRICNNDMDSEDFNCILESQVHLGKEFKHICGHCEELCENTKYNYETTTAELQDYNLLWADTDPKGKPPPAWANHKMSVIHVFFGSATTMPKLRKRLLGFTDLLANTGGILGLCLGFSVLSGVEVIYFLTIRAFWKFCRVRTIRRQIRNKFLRLFKPNNSNGRVIRVNAKTVPIYPMSFTINGIK